MAERLREFAEFKDRAEDRVLDYINSRTSRQATVSDIRSFCRMASMSGMTEAILEWLEKRGAIHWQRDTETVYLNPEWGKIDGSSGKGVRSSAATGAGKK